MSFLNPSLLWGCLPRFRGVLVFVVGCWGVFVGGCPDCPMGRIPVGGLGYFQRVFANVLCLHCLLAWFVVCLVG